MQQSQARSRPLAVVVTPTFDEYENIIDLIDSILAEQTNIPGFDLQVLVSDSHSKDGTLELVQTRAESDPCVHLLDVNRRGIGLGLFHGFHYAIERLNADVLVEMDSDFQHNPADIPGLLAPLGQGYDVVVGSRFVEGSMNKMPFIRRVLSIGANGVIRLALGLRDVTEITTSFRAFRKESFLRLNHETVPWEDQSFIAVPVFLVRMLEAGARATEVPMTMHPRMRGYSKMIYWKYIRDILWFSARTRLAQITKRSAKWTSKTKWQW